MRRLAALLLLLPGFAVAETPAVRVGDHPGFGRLVFEFSSETVYRVELREGGATLRFDGAPAPAATALRRLPRNVLALTPAEGGVDIQLAPGTGLRHFRLGNRIVLDLRDAAPAVAPPPAAPQAAASAATTARPPPAATAAPRPPTPRPAPAARAVPPAAPAAPAPVVAAAPPAPASPPVIAASAAPPALLEPDAVPVRLLSPPGQPRAIAIALPAGTGAAVLRRGAAVLAVFDVARPLNLTALQGDPLFGGAEALTLSDATVLRLPLAAPALLRVRLEAGAWILEPSRDAASARTMLPEIEAGPPAMLALRSERPGRVVTIADPETGLPLLLGSVEQPGQAAPIARIMPQAELLPTLLGAAVLARADTVSLRRAGARFLLTAGEAGLRLTSTDGALPEPDAAAMTRLFDIPDLPLPALAERLRAQQAGIVAAPPLQRAALRRDAAETMLALGLAQEAQAMLAIGLAEDPRVAEAPRSLALLGAAALLSGRIAEARPLDDPRLPQADEVALWRGALAAARGEAAAPTLAATLPLLLSYPEALRGRLVAPIAEALASGGEGAALRRLQARSGDDPALAFASAILAETDGRHDEALAGYAAVAGGRDRLRRARALRRAAELQLATGRLNAAGAAAALEASLFAWRGDAEDFATRLRIAELRTAIGEPRATFALLRETEAQFPERAAALRPPLQASLVAALATEPPIQAIALYDAHHTLLPSGAVGDAAAEGLAERLVALDLAARADRLLSTALDRAEAAASRDRLGQRLAVLRLEEGNAAGAIAALEASHAGVAPGAARSVLHARAEARQGNLAAAVARLDALGAPGALPKADLLEVARDWPGAAAALASHLDAALPAAPAAIDAVQRRLLVRLAAYAALAGEDARLTALHAAFNARMDGGPGAEAFSVLTADPLRGLADLPRLAREMDMLRNLPARLEPLRTVARLTP